jgi:GTP cyclohydrolase IA
MRACQSDASTMPPDIAGWLREVLGENPDLRIIANSEDRIARAYREYLSGYHTDETALIKIVEDNYSGNAWVEQSGIPLFSFCAHHFLPFFGTASVKYKPNKKIIGIGKLPRIVDCFARRLTMQETIVKQVGDFIFEQVGAIAVRVDSSARHLCVEARGPRAVGSVTSCSYNRGEGTDVTSVA